MDLCPLLSHDFSDSSLRSCLLLAAADIVLQDAFVVAPRLAAEDSHAFARSVASAVQVEMETVPLSALQECLPL